MKLIEFSVKNSLTVNLITFFVIVLGFSSMLNLRRDSFPNVSFDVVTVTTVYSGAPAEDVEKLVTIPLEKEIRAVSGIKEMSSSSDEGLSSISIKLEPNVVDKRQVVDDIRRSVDRVNSLPEEVDDPVVVEINTKEMPILEISLSGEASESIRREYAERLEEKIEDVSGVAKVLRIGWRDPEFWVELDPIKLKESYVSMDEVMNALRLRNVTLPAGQIKTESGEYNVRVTGEFKTTKEIEEVIIRANDSGNWLKIKDVGQVVDTFEDETHVAKINGVRTIAMVVIKQELADTIKVADQVKKVIENFKSTLPEGFSVTISNDFSFYVKRRLGVVQSNGIQGFILVILILFLFMDPVPAIMTALGIPFALFVTFAVMQMLGMSINLVTMLGLIIVLGMLVDDGIVVCENIYRYMEKGVPVKEAVVKGTQEVIGPVLGTVLTTWAAFLPLMFMSDIIGQFVRQIPIVVIVALAASLAEAFFCLPAHYADFVKPLKRDKEGRIQDVQHKPWFAAMLKGYTNILQGALRHRYLVLGGLVVLFVFSIFIAVFHMKIILFTGEGIEEFNIRAESKKGTTLEKMEELLIPVEQLIAALPKEELDSYRTYIGSIENESGFDANARRGTHLAQMTVFLTPMQKRNRTPDEIVESMRPQLEKIAGFEKLYFFRSKEGPPVGSAVEIKIKGDNYSVLQELSDKYVKRLSEIEGVSDISSSYQFGKKQLKVVVDEEKARQYYVSIDDVARTVRNVFKGGVATTIKPEKAEEEIKVKVRFPEVERNQRQTFDKIYVMNQLGKLVALSSFSKVEESEGIFTINHLDGKRVVVIAADVDNKNATSASVNGLLKKEESMFLDNYPNYTVKYGGEFEEQRASQKNLLTSMAIALLLIFIILAATFNSLLEPFIVMLAVPFGLIGVILAFWLHGRPLGFFALMGLVGLTGVVVNDSIVLVEFIKKLREEGKSKLESIIEAGRIRLRPILMTTITTIGGLVSVAYGIGGGDPFLKPMALAIVWGLFFSAFLTLLAIPCVYATLDDFFARFLRKKFL